jgi:hypothetical protein
MSPRPTRAGLAVTLLVALTACGRHESYCDRVTSHPSEIASAAGNGDRTGVLQLLPAFQDLQDAAPDDVQDDYQLLVTRITALRSALDAAGVDPSSYDPRHPPAGLTDAQRGAIRQAAAGLAAPDVAQALASVQQEVLDVCHTPLDL